MSRPKNGESSGRSGAGPVGSAIRYGKDGLKVVRSAGARWTDQAEQAFLDHLAASCNVMHSADAAGFRVESIYKRRREDPVFAQRWQAALEQGYPAATAIRSRTTRRRML